MGMCIICHARSPHPPIQDTESLSAQTPLLKNLIGPGQVPEVIVVVPVGVVSFFERLERLVKAVARDDFQRVHQVLVAGVRTHGRLGDLRPVRADSMSALQASNGRVRSADIVSAPAICAQFGRTACPRSKLDPAWVKIRLRDRPGGFEQWVWAFEPWIWLVSRGILTKSPQRNLAWGLLGNRGGQTHQTHHFDHVKFQRYSARSALS